MITTTSGTYTIEEYEKIHKTLEQAFIDFWHGRITIEEHKKILKDSGFTDAEIRGAQYSASFKD